MEPQSHLVPRWHHTRSRPQDSRAISKLRRAVGKRQGYGPQSASSRVPRNCSTDPGDGRSGQAYPGLVRSPRSPTVMESQRSAICTAHKAWVGMRTPRAPAQREAHPLSHVAGAGRNTSDQRQGSAPRRARTCPEGHQETTPSENQSVCAKTRATQG